MIRKKLLIDSNRELARSLKIMHEEYFECWMNYKGRANPGYTREKLRKQFSSMPSVQNSDSVLKRHGLLLEGSVRWPGTPQPVVNKKKNPWDIATKGMDDNG